MVSLCNKGDVSWAALSICLAVLSVFSCGKQSDDKDLKEIKNAADKFATYYFNYDFKRTFEYATEESAGWISFVASNVGQEDIDILRNQTHGAMHTIKNVKHENDTLATVALVVDNFLKIDTLGLPGKITSEEDYTMTLVKRDGKWVVKMEGPLQSGKRSRD